MRHEIINDINVTVKTLLETELKTVFKNVTVKMADLENFKKGESKTGVNVFLYSVMINEPGHSGQQVPDSREEGPNGETIYVFYPPPVNVTLSFMFTPFASDPQTEYRLLGRIIQLFQENPLLVGTQLKGDWLPSLERLGFTPDMNLSFERQLEIFRSFDAPMKMSVGYVARTTLTSDKVIRRSKVARAIRPEFRKDEKGFADPQSQEGTGGMPGPNATPRK